MVPQPPLCGCNLQSASKIIAIIDLVLAILSLILGVVAAILVLVVGLEGNSNQDGATVALVAYIVLAITVLVAIVQIVIAWILLQGSNLRHYGKCRIWFIITTVLLVFNIVGFVLNLFGTLQVIDIIVNIISILYHIFGLWVVYAFMDELNSEMPR